MHGPHSYYRCTRNTVSRDLCSARFSNVDRAHESLLRLYAALPVSGELKVAIKERARAEVDRRAVAARRRAASLSMVRAHLESREVKLTELYADGQAMIESYRVAVGKLRQELQGVEKAIASAEDDPAEKFRRLEAVVDRAGSVADLHRVLTFEAKQQLIRVLFREIALSEGRIVRFTLNAPFDRLLLRGGGDQGGDGTPPEPGVPAGEPGQGGDPELDVNQVGAAIVDIFEFDTVRLPGAIHEHFQAA